MDTSLVDVASQIGLAHLMPLYHHQLAEDLRVYHPFHAPFSLIGRSDDCACRPVVADTSGGFIIGDLVRDAFQAVCI